MFAGHLANTLEVLGCQFAEQTAGRFFPLPAFVTKMPCSGIKIGPSSRSRRRIVKPFVSVQTVSRLSRPAQLLGGVQHWYDDSSSANRLRPAIAMRADQSLSFLVAGQWGHGTHDRHMGLQAAVEVGLLRSRLGSPIPSPGQSVSTARHSDRSREFGVWLAAPPLYSFPASQKTAIISVAASTRTL